jgi:predicted SnoaL-like aldol condensation-catalyzing enzyme
MTSVDSLYEQAMELGEGARTELAERGRRHQAGVLAGFDGIAQFATMVLPQKPPL